MSKKRQNAQKIHGLFRFIGENILLLCDGIRFLPILWRESKSEK